MREELGDTMEAFAKRMRVSLNTVSRWENSQPPRAKTLEKLWRFAKRREMAWPAEILLLEINREKSEEYKRYRTAQIVDAANLYDMRALLREWWKFEDGLGQVDPVFNEDRRENFLRLADLLWIGGRKEFLGEFD